MKLDDLNYKVRPYNAVEAYSQSKLANVLFSKELAAKLKVNIFMLNTKLIGKAVKLLLDSIYTLQHSTMW